VQGQDLGSEQRLRQPGRIVGMGCWLTLLLVRRILGLLGLGPASDQKDVEIAVLRHQLAILRRQVARPGYSPTDRAVLATLARLLSWERRGVSGTTTKPCMAMARLLLTIWESWLAFLVTPATLMRWQRDLVARSCSYPRRNRTAPNAFSEEVAALVTDRNARRDDSRSGELLLQALGRDTTAPTGEEELDEAEGAWVPQRAAWGAVDHDEVDDDKRLVVKGDHARGAELPERHLEPGTPARDLVDAVKLEV
jgi:hypothetical protein